MRRLPSFSVSVQAWREVGEFVHISRWRVLFLAGLEIDLRKLRGPVLRLTALGFALSFGIGVLVALGLKGAGLVDTPLLVAIILCATSLGVLVLVVAGRDAAGVGEEVSP